MSDSSTASTGYKTPNPKLSDSPLQERLRLAIVGHTNTGKTSLLRTLARNPLFGEVADQPGTTRFVEKLSLSSSNLNDAVIEFFDTPGIEDSIGLRDYFEQLNQNKPRLDGVAEVKRFLTTPESQGRFEQEARVLKQLLESDAALYVVDVRDPILAKHQDELALLALCGRPLLPVLNFLHGHKDQTQTWRKALANLGLHICVEFDTVAPALDGEDQLYQRLSRMLEHHTYVLERFRENIQAERQARLNTAYTVIADLLIDVAAYRLNVKNDTTALEQASQNMHNTVRQREQLCIRELLQVYNFRQSDYPNHRLPLKDGTWPLDLFNPEALKEMGIELSKGVAAGAVAGLTIDALTGGLSLGAAPVIGATTGGLWQGARKFGRQLLGQARGYQDLVVDTPVLCLLALRQLHLLNALCHRGHAAINPIEIVEGNNGPNKPTIWHQNQLPPILRQARNHPEWSTLSHLQKTSIAREDAITELSQQLKNDWHITS